MFFDRIYLNHIKKRQCPTSLPPKSQRRRDYEEENSKGKKVTRTDIHTHMLRGTFATRCAEAKIAPSVLKEILGHSDISITMKYYVDIDNDFIKSENKNVVNYLIDKNIFGVILGKEEIAV